jgi:hypothetical protein
MQSSCQLLFVLSHGTIQQVSEETNKKMYVYLPWTTISHTLNNKCIFFQLSFSLSVSFLSCFFYSSLLVCQLFFQAFHNNTISLLLSKVANCFQNFSGGPNKKFGRRSRSLKSLHIHKNFCLLICKS